MLLCNFNNLVKATKSAKRKWAGHVQRTNDNRWTKRVTEWIPRDQKRSRGRQKTRWRDEMNRFSRSWRQLAHNRAMGKNEEGLYPAVGRSDCLS